MSQIGESSANAKIEVEIIPDETLERIKIRLSVFFDGTKNNRTNTDLIKKLRTEAENNGKKLEDNKLFKYAKSGTSYTNDYTNVAKMERYIESGSDKIYQKKLSIYIEGPGTDDKKSDRLVGYAFGMGRTGISEKVKKGIVESVNEIIRSLDKKSIIELLTLDVFGFSRGAAAARYFIHQAILSELKIKDALQEKDCVLERINVNFAGLYDTVASHGIRYANDTSDLKLFSVNRAETVVQLAAADEHRERFSLTTIHSTGKRGREIFLPGVHSDIGGSYNETEIEEQIIYDSFDIKEAQQDKKNLIEAGWFKEHEIELIEIEDEYESFNQMLLKINRTISSNQYSRIPLHIMTGFARESGIDVKDKLDKIEKIPDTLLSTYNKIKTYVDKTQLSRITDWQHNEPWLCELRNQYLHFSARCEIGLGPRIENGQRVRMRFDG